MRDQLKRILNILEEAPTTNVGGGEVNMNPTGKPKMKCNCPEGKCTCAKCNCPEGKCTCDKK